MTQQQVAQQQVTERETSTVTAGRRRRRVAPLVTGVVFVLVVAAGTAAAVGFGGSNDAGPTRGTLPPATAAITRGTLTETADVSGTLGYGGAVPVSGKVSGMVTALPAISEEKARVGDQATGQILAYTETTKTVAIDLDVAKQQLVKPGIQATVKLPDDTSVTGVVSTVGTVATTKTTGSGTTATTVTTIEVTVTIADQAALGTFDQAPVTVTLVSSQRRDVLTVPISALLVLVEGGYGVEIVDGSTTKIVAVSVGLFASGRVEIGADGISAGQFVGVPK